MKKLSRQIYDEITKQLDFNSLPGITLPEIILRINHIMHDDMANAEDLVLAIRADELLSTRILRISNAPALRGNYKTIALAESVLHLGMTTIRNLAISLSFIDHVRGQKSKFTTLIEDELAACVERAVVGCILSNITTGLMAESAIVVGLIGRIGQIVTILFIASSENYSTIDQEKVLSIANEIGNALSDKILSSWDFPSGIVDAVVSKTSANLLNPVTYQDISALADAYIGHTLPAEKYEEIELILLHYEEDSIGLRSLLR